MNNTKQLITIGLIFIITIIAFIWGFNFLKGRSIFKKQYKYYAVYANISGLTEGADVTISGRKIGQVYNIKFTNGKTPKLVVEIILEHNIKIPKNSIAEIYSLDFMGTKGIRIIYDTTSTDYYNIGDTLKSSIEKDLMQEVNEQLLPLKRRTEQILSSFDSVLTIIQAIFNKNTQNNLYSSFNDISLTIKHIEHTTYVLDTLLSKPSGRINKTISALAALSQLLQKNKDTLQLIFNNLQVISDSLKNSNIPLLITNTQKTMQKLNDILTKINNGKGDLGKFVNNDSLYNALTKISNNLNIILEDFKLNPKHYLNISFINLGRYYQYPKSRK